MTNTLTPKALHDTLTEANRQKDVLKRIVAALSNRPETRDAVIEALKIDGVDKNELCDAVSAGYYAVCEHVNRLNAAYVNGIVTRPDKPD